MGLAGQIWIEYTCLSLYIFEFEIKIVFVLLFFFPKIQ